MHCTFEATCWLWLGCCWNNNVANSHFTLLHSTAYYCAPVWCCSAHTCLIDPAIKDALWTMTGFLRLAPADNFPFLAGTQSSDLRRNGATVSLVRRPTEPWHLFRSALACPPSGNARHLKSRRPFHTRCPTTHQFIWWQKQKWAECGKVGVHYETPHFPPWPTLMEWHCREQRAVTQPEWDQRGHGPLRNNLAKIFTGDLHQFSIVRR